MLRQCQPDKEKRERIDLKTRPKPCVTRPKKQLASSATRVSRGRQRGKVEGYSTQRSRRRMPRRNYPTIKTRVGNNSKQALYAAVPRCTSRRVPPPMERSPTGRATTQLGSSAARLRSDIDAEFNREK